MSHSNELVEDSRIEAARLDLESLILWLNANYKIELPSDTRSLMAISCLDIALEHQMAIEVLARHGLYGSMLALVRVAFEALVRGVWLARCASDAQLEYFRTHDEIKDKNFGALVSEVEDGIGHTARVLLKLKKQSWGAMNSFTHTGMMQITRRHSSGVIGPNYSVADILLALSGAGVFGLLAAIEMATIAGNEALALKTLERSRAFAKRPKSR